MSDASPVTTSASVSEEQPSTGTAAAGARIKTELLLAAEIAGLCGLAFTRPILDSYGRAPEAFLAREASRLDIVLFALVVAVLPTVVLALAAAATNLGGHSVRRAVQLGSVGVLAAVVVWRFGTDLTSWGGSVLAPLALLGGVEAVALRWRIPPFASFLRFLGAASVMFLVLFLIASPSSDLVLQGSASIADEEMTSAVLEGTGDDPPPIVTLVVDALPTAMLLDGEGNIDASLYPNLAALAGESTWYRNYTTVSAWTFQAVPAMLSGQLPAEGDLPDVQTFPENFFTLFADTHDIHATEQISRLCPSESCPRTTDSALTDLLGDAADWWRDGADPEQEVGQVLPGALDPNRGQGFEEWMGAQNFPAGSPAAGADRPGLWSYHLIMPHEPWDILADGSRYDVVDEDIHGLFLHNEWQDVGAEVGRQRQLLQTVAVDRMIGDLIELLRAHGIYDEAMITVVGDHGQAFTAGEPLRGVTEAQYEQVLWTPLIVKAPGQDTGDIDETNLQSVDLMSVLAETLGIRLPWEVENLTTPEADSQDADGDDKMLLDGDLHQMPADEGSPLIRVDGAEGYDRVLEARALDEPGAGEAGIWQRTDYGGLIGQPLSGLEVEGDQVAGELAVEQLDALESQSGERLLLELIGEADLDLDAIVAIEVNGQVAAVAPAAAPLSYSVEDGEMELGVDRDDEVAVHALLHPDPFMLSGPNDLAAYLVEGQVGEETLIPLELAPA